MTIRSDEQWFSLVDAFQAAALGERSWDVALQGFAAATGSRGSQLIGRKADLSVVFNVMTNSEPVLQRLVIERQSLNPRPPVVERAPILATVADWDVLSPEQSKRDTFYQEVLRPWDAPFFCATVLARHEHSFVTLGVVRSQADGYITPEQRGIFALLAPHARAAIRLQHALEDKGAAVLAGCMEALSIPLFLCDWTGRVRLLTSAAEALVANRGGLELKDGRLHAARATETRSLHEAIDGALRVDRPPGPPVLRTVVVHDREGDAAPIVLDVFPIPPRPGALRLSSSAPRVLIVACGQRRGEARRTAILGAVYGLTAAETEVAQRLAAGTSAQAIAVQRGVAVGTVRTQIKAVLAKLGVRRQTELSARLNQL